MNLILSEKRPGGIDIWTLNRPEKRNALSIELLKELHALVHAVDGETRAVVITGAGNVFCAGLDLSILRNLNEAVIDEYHSAAAETFADLYCCAAPTIAAVRGAALAGGFDLATMCDLRVSTPDAKFGQLETRLGLTGLTEPHWRIMGLGRAKESIYTAAIYDGREAHRIGLVNRLADDPLAEALNLAESIAKNDPAAIRAVKKMTGGFPAEEVRDAILRQLERFREFLKSPEARAKIAAYVATL